MDMITYRYDVPRSLSPDGKPKCAHITRDRCGGSRNPWSTSFEGLPGWFVWPTKQDAEDNILSDLARALTTKSELSQ